MPWPSLRLLKALHSKPSDVNDDEPSSKRNKSNSLDVMSTSDYDHDDFDEEISQILGPLADEEDKPCA